jgi:nicotinamidase-related amidase
MPVAVITIDLQYDFIDTNNQAVGRTNKSLCIPGVRRIIAAARRRAWPIFHVTTEHSNGGTIPKHLERRGLSLFCHRATPGVALIDGLHEEGDAAVVKKSYSAFLSGELGAMVDKFEHLILLGISTDCCILQSGFDAVTRLEKNIYVPFDAVSCARAMNHSVAIGIIAKSLGCVVSAETLTNYHDPNIWCENRLEPDDACEVAMQWFTNAEGRLAREVGGAPNLARLLSFLGSVDQL